MPAVPECRVSAHVDTWQIRLAHAVDIAGDSLCPRVPGKLGSLRQRLRAATSGPADVSVPATAVLARCWPCSAQTFPSNLSGGVACDESSPAAWEASASEGGSRADSV